MVTKTGKLFRNLQSGKVETLSYDNTQNYYQFVEEAHNKGYKQCIVTSDIMIRILEHYILKHKIEIVDVEFFVDDEELNQEIKRLIVQLNDNLAYWDILRTRLVNISQKDSIDIKKIEFKLFEDRGCLCNVYVNGILSVYENLYEKVSGELEQVLEGCIK